ncbi:MAG: GDP-mannose 4,6-dehydratase [archaeon]
MKLLVTGGCGFIGSNFIKLLFSEHPEWKIMNLDKLTYAGRLENLTEVEANSNYEFIKGDICDKKTVKKAMKECNAVINFAAESFVDKAISSPEAFIKTDVIGTYTLLEEARKNDLEKFIQISCYDEKTRALTTDGLKKFNELKKGDNVFSINPHTQEIEVKAIEKVIIQDYEGKMIHFKNKRVDIKVTPNHRMFILNTRKKLVVESAEEASKRSIFFMPATKWNGKEDGYCSVEGHGKVKTKDLFYIIGIFIGDGFLAYQEKKVKTKSGLNREDFLKEARDGAGKFKKIENESGYEAFCRGYRIFFDIPENDKCRIKVEKTLKNLGIRYNKHCGKAGTHLYFSSKAWLNFFKQFGKGAHNKDISGWVLEYSPKYLKYLFEGLMDSDGHKEKIYYTVSEKLVSSFCELCIKLGLKASVGKRHTLSFLNERKIEGDSYYIVVSKTTKSISKKMIKKLNYKGKIWCLKVKDNKNFLIEREGKFDFCGNTDEVYGSIEEGSFTETSPLKPRNPYSASKAGADSLAYSYFITYGLPVIITRSSNNFGPNQFPEKVIPLFITNILRDKKVPLYGDGKNVRDWLYVKDNCKAIELLLRNGRNGEAYNIGGSNEKENIELTRIILNELGRDESFIEFVKDRIGHDRRYSLNCGKVMELGWKPEKDFDEALKETIEWYSKNKGWWEPLVK